MNEKITTIEAVKLTKRLDNVFQNLEDAFIVLGQGNCTPKEFETLNSILDIARSATSRGMEILKEAMGEELTLEILQGNMRVKYPKYWIYNER